MSRFTKALRQKIVQEFAVRHNGQYDAALFVAEVRDTGPTHPAYSWFEWDKAKAAAAYQIEQAREFARDLRVTFTVQVINGGKRSVKVRESAMPLVISPIEGRAKGGGYLLVDPDNPAYMAEHCRQAAMALKSWLGRYQSALDHVGETSEALAALVEKFEAVTVADQAA